MKRKITPSEYGICLERARITCEETREETRNVLRRALDEPLYDDAYALATFTKNILRSARGIVAVRTARLAEWDEDQPYAAHPGAWPNEACERREWLELMRPLLARARAGVRPCRLRNLAARLGLTRDDIAPLPRR